MQKKMTLVNITQNKQRGTLLFNDAEESNADAGRPGAPQQLRGNTIAVQCNDPKEVAAYEIGASYTITIAKA